MCEQFCCPFTTTYAMAFKACAVHVLCVVVGTWFATRIQVEGAVKVRRTAATEKATTATATATAIVTAPTTAVIVVRG